MTGVVLDAIGDLDALDARVGIRSDRGVIPGARLLAGALSRLLELVGALLLGVETRRGLRLLVEVGQVGDLLSGEAVELGPLLVGEQVRPHEPGQDEVAAVGAHGARQRQQRPRKDQMDQEGAKTPLPQGEQQTGGQRPHERGPGPQDHLPGHGAGSEPGSQGGERYGQKHQAADEGAGVQPDEPAQCRRPGQNGQQRGDAARVTVSGGDPSGPGGVPHLPPAAEQRERAADNGTGGQQPGQAIGAQRRRHYHDGAQGPTSAAGQGGELTQLELTGGGRAGPALALLAGAVAAHAPDLGRSGVEAPKRGDGHLGVPGESAPGRLDPSTAAGHRQGRTEFVAGKRWRLGGKPPYGPHRPEDDEPGQQQADGAGGEGRPVGELCAAAGAEGSLRVGLGEPDLDGLGVGADLGTQGVGDVGGTAQSLVGGPPVTDNGGGLDDDPVSGQARRAGELQAVAERSEPRGDAADLLPHGAVDEGAGCSYGQDVAAVVVLALVDLTGDDVVGAPGRGRGPQSDLQKQLRIVPTHLLGANDPHGAGVGCSGEKMLETALLGRGVVMEQPEPHLMLWYILGGIGRSHEPLLVGGDRRERSCGTGDGTGTGQQQVAHRSSRTARGSRGTVGIRAFRAVDGSRAAAPAVAGGDQFGVGGQSPGDRVPEAPGFLDPYDAYRRDGAESRALDELLDRGPIPQPVCSRGDVDDEDDVGRAGLGGDCGQCLRQERARPGRHDDGQGSYPTGSLCGAGAGHTARRLSLRRSRSDMPPQIPKRSSLARAYSRHSSRTSQVAQTRLASRVEPPFSGKKASGSVWAHRARSCHARGPSSTSSPPPKRSDSTSASGSSGCFSGPSPRMFHMPASLRSELLASKNYMRVRQGQSSQGGKLHPLVTVDTIP